MMKYLKQKNNLFIIFLFFCSFNCTDYDPKDYISVKVKNLTNETLKISWDTYAFDSYELLINGSAIITVKINESVKAYGEKSGKYYGQKIFIYNNESWEID
jgi:hypothetical protein